MACINKKEHFLLSNEDSPFNQPADILCPPLIRKCREALRINPHLGLFCFLHQTWHTKTMKCFSLQCSILPKSNILKEQGHKIYNKYPTITIVNISKSYKENKLSTLKQIYFLEYKNSQQKFKCLHCSNIHNSKLMMKQINTALLCF